MCVRVRVRACVSVSVGGRVCDYPGWLQAHGQPAAGNDCMGEARRALDGFCGRATFPAAATPNSGWHVRSDAGSPKSVVI